jgi:peptide/nickel transport system substrate-binding protein
MPRSVYFGRASTGSPEGLPEFSFILVGWGAGSGEASSPLKSLIHTYDKDAGFGSSNRGRHSDPETDALIEEALRTVDDAKRQDLLARATERAIENVAIIPTHFQVNTWAAKKGLSYVARTDEYTLATGVVKD